MDNNTEEVNRPKPDDASTLKSKSGISRIFKACQYSWHGFCSAWKSEQAFKQELLIIIPAVIIAVFIPVATIEKILLVSSLILILIVELLNSAIEAVVDRISLDKHHLSKNAKDFGSAAVFLAVALAIFTWGLIICAWLAKF